MPEFDHDCGRGCACNNCGGCIRAGGRCRIYPLPRLSFAELADVLQPFEERLGPDERVTINVSDLSLAEVAMLVAAVHRDPLAVPAERGLQNVTLRMKDVPLSEVVAELGLLPR